MSDRFDPRSRALADRHYNRQKIGTPQILPPGAVSFSMRRQRVAKPSGLRRGRLLSTSNTHGLARGFALRSATKALAYRRR